MFDPVVWMKSRLYGKKRYPLWLHRPAYVNRHPGATVLVVATGPSLRTHREDVQNWLYGPGCNAVTIVCNYAGDLCVPMYQLFANRRRLVTFGGGVHPASSLLIGSYIGHRAIRHAVGDRGYEEVPYAGPYSSEAGSLRIDRRGVVHLTGGTVATIAIGVAIVMGARWVYCAGLDGFSQYAGNPDDIHFFQDADSIDFQKRLMHEQCTHGILRDAAAILEQRGGGLRILTPSVYFHGHVTVL